MPATRPSREPGSPPATTCRSPPATTSRASCAIANYAGSLPATFSAVDVDLSRPPGAGAYVAKVFCIKNAGTAPAQLTASVVNLVQTEAGCSDGEAEAGDATCGDGVGELGAVVDETFSMASDAGSDPACTAATFPVSRFESGYIDAVLHASLPAGGHCRFVYMLSPTFLTVTEAQRLQAQSDGVQWDVVLRLEDVIAV